MIHALLCYEAVNLLIVVLYFLFFVLVKGHIIFDYLVSELVGGLAQCFRLLLVRGMRKLSEKIGGNTSHVNEWEDKMVTQLVLLA